MGSGTVARKVQCSPGTRLAVRQADNTHVNTTLPQTGEVFDFRYRIVCRLGYGSDGYMFGATELDTGKRVAIKCWVGPHAEQALAAAQHFVRTAHQFRLFDNPNIVEVFAAEVGHTVSYCVMDWLEGMTLARRIMRRRPSPLSDVFNIVLPCMRAVAEAHAAGIIHGDVRPGHIFVCHATKHRPAIARIFDFGRPPAGLPTIPNVAVALNAEAYYYASPEQLLGEPLDARSDMYAFGIMLFEMLAGERPYVAESSEELAERIKAGAPKLLAVSAPSIPVRLANIIERAMAVDPANRFANLNELIDALQAFQHALQPSAALPAVAIPVSNATAAAIRGVAEARERSLPPPPPVKRVISAQSADTEDITTTSASWEMTDPLPIGRYQYELFKRIGWKRGALWASALAAAFVAAQLSQPTDAPQSPLPPASAPGARDHAGAAPGYVFDPATCNDAIGATDPNCAYVIPPIPVPAVIEPVVPPPAPSIDPHSPRVTISMPEAPPQQPLASEPPARPRRTKGARVARNPAAGSASPKPRVSADDKQLDPKRPRNPEGSRSDDPFERLQHMRLQ